MALGWPILASLLSMATVTTQSLLLMGAFYAAMAKQLRAVRLSYLSLGLFKLGATTLPHRSGLADVALAEYHDWTIRVVHS